MGYSDRPQALDVGAVLQETTRTREARAQKIFYFGLLIVLLFGILTIQLARMQLVNGDKYKLRAETNRLRAGAARSRRVA